MDAKEISIEQMIDSVRVKFRAICKERDEWKERAEEAERKLDLLTSDLDYIRGDY